MGLMSSVFNQVKSERLVNDIGLKTKVTLGDILDILKAWRKSSKTSFKARYTHFWLLCTNKRTWIASSRNHQYDMDNGYN